MTRIIAGRRSWPTARGTGHRDQTDRRPCASSLLVLDRGDGPFRRARAGSVRGLRRTGVRGALTRRSQRHSGGQQPAAVQVMRRNVATVGLPGSTWSKPPPPDICADNHNRSTSCCWTPYDLAADQIEEILTQLCTGWLVQGAVVVVEQGAGMSHRGGPPDSAPRGIAVSATPNCTGGLVRSRRHSR